MSPAMDNGENRNLNVLPTTPTLTVHLIPILDHSKIFLFPPDLFSCFGTDMARSPVALYLWVSVKVAFIYLFGKCVIHFKTAFS